MNLRLLLILQLLTVLHLTKAESGPGIFPACVVANEDCDFEFEGFEGVVATFPIGIKADVPFTTRIVSKDPSENLGVLNSNGMTPEAIRFDGVGIPITELGNPPFTPTHAKPFPLPDGGSGIGHQTLTANQLESAPGACVRVFFSSYQLIVGPKPTDVVNINAKKGDFKCAVFFVE